MSGYSESEVKLSNATLIRGFGLYDDYAKYSFYSLGVGSSTVPKPVCTRSYFLAPEGERRFLERLGDYISLVESNRQQDETNRSPSYNPTQTPKKLKQQLGWVVFGSKLIDPTEQGLQTYLGNYAKKTPQLILGHAFRPGIDLNVLQLSGTMLNPKDAQKISDVFSFTRQPE